MTNRKVNALLGLILVSTLSFLALTTETHATPAVVSAETISMQPNANVQVGNGFVHLKVDNTNTATHDIKVGSCWQDVTIAADNGYPVSFKGGWFQLDLTEAGDTIPFSFDVCTGDGNSTSSCTTVQFAPSGTVFSQRASTPIVEPSTSCVKPASGYPGYPGYPGSWSGGSKLSNVMRSYLPILTSTQP